MALHAPDAVVRTRARGPQLRGRAGLAATAQEQFLAQARRDNARLRPVPPAPTRSWLTRRLWDPPPVPTSPAEVRRRIAVAEAERIAVEKAAVEVRGRTDAAQVRLATDPAFSARVLHPEDRAAFVGAVAREERTAESLEAAAAAKREEIAALFRQAVAETNAATARRRALRLGQEVEELSDLEEQLREKKLTPWEVRRLKAELLGYSGGMVTGKYQPGELTRAEVRHVEVVMGEMRRKHRWTNRAEDLREALWRRGNRTDEKMADYFESIGRGRHEGFFLFYRY